MSAAQKHSIYAPQGPACPAISFQSDDKQVYRWRQRQSFAAALFPTDEGGSSLFTHVAGVKRGPCNPSKHGQLHKGDTGDTHPERPLNAHFHGGS